MIDVSIIITVYNKSPYLAVSVPSLLQQQQEGITLEYIFVDDCSRDDSVAVLKRLTNGHSGVRIIENNENKGPSVRLNQGAALAQGQYLHFIDGDDVMPGGTSRYMFGLLQQEQADLIYGKWHKSRLDVGQLKDQKIDQNAEYHVTDQPLGYMMKGGFVRMVLMCKKTLFEQAKGCDEGVFIQDESLPLRLGAESERFIDLNTPVVYVPMQLIEAYSSLSDNKAQQHHDKFLAYYRFFVQRPQQAQTVEKKIYGKCVSSYWKYTRQHGRFPYIRSIFGRYLLTKWLKPRANRKTLDWLFQQFKAIPDIKRMEKNT